MNFINTVEPGKLKFFKSLMARKKRNEKFKKDFIKKTGVDLNQIDPGGNAKPRI
tara:strand:- start:303 stop:464 length:162 start_codon:yes stop_codon:yes gene_type:complete